MTNRDVLAALESVLAARSQSVEDFEAAQGWKPGSTRRTLIGGDEPVLPRNVHLIADRLGDDAEAFLARVGHKK